MQSRARRTAALAMAVADTDPEKIEATAQQLGSRRSYLAPIAWAAGSLVLLARGVTLLLTNWRLTLIQLLPAALIWAAMYDLKVHALYDAQFRTLSLQWVTVGTILLIAACVASFWCNTVFAYAIDSTPPHIRPAVAATRRRLVPIFAAGVLGGLLLSFATLYFPRFGRPWLFDGILLGVIGLLIVAFVAVPARIIERRTRKLPPREAMGRTMVGWLVSIVAMTPGFLLDRTGLIMMGIPGLRILGFLVLSIGTALYAAGMSSVKAVKMSIKLGTTPARPAPAPPPPDDVPAR